jgi:hypothetical protein
MTYTILCIIPIQVLEILQSSSSTDLFAPEIEEGQLKKTADPVTSDLLEALLSVRSHLYYFICDLWNMFNQWY